MGSGAALHSCRRREEGLDMKLMVIGAYGNLGSELRRQSSHTIVPVGRREWAGMTARDLAGVDLVIHAAADIHTPASEQPSAVLSSGPMLTARLLELMGKQGTPRLMYVSSCSVYGVAPTVEEAAPCCPLTINGQLNLLNENLIESYCNRHGVEWEVYRLFNTFGGSDRFSIVSRIIAAAQEGRPLTVLNNGHSRRDFIHVADTATILLELATRRPTRSRINIGTGHATRIDELVVAAREIHPELDVCLDPTPDPVARSVADTTRLAASIGPYCFIPVLDYLRQVLVAAES